MQDFVNSRINPQFASGYYSTLIKNNDSVKMKQIRNSRMMFRSSSTGKALEGVDVDGLSLDEYDRLNPTAEISAKESLSSSKYGLLRRWSTPTQPNMGIDLKYAESDQRKWVYKCQHCGLVQQLDYDKNIKLINKGGIDLIGKVIDEGTYQYVCQKCGKPIDRWYSGFWDITAPRSGRAHGYEISQMDAVWISASQMKQKELEAPSKQFFFNYSLGRPYQDNSNTLFEQDITSHMDDSVVKSELRGDYRLITVGIDWGQHQHSVVVTGMKPNGRVDLIGLKRIDRSEGVDEIERDLYQIVNYIRPFEPDLILPDIGYNGNYNDRLTQIFGKEVVYGVKVRSAKSNGDYNAHFNDGVSTVTIDKLSQNLIAMNEIKAGDIHFYNQYDADLQLYAKHWGNVVIRQEESKDGKSVDTVITRKGGDHYSQSFVYSLVGMRHLIDQLREQQQSSPLMTAPLELSGTGYNPERTNLQEEFDISPENDTFSPYI